VSNEPVPGNKLFKICESVENIDCKTSKCPLCKMCDRIETDTGYTVATLFDYLVDYENPKFYNLPKVEEKGDLEKQLKTMLDKLENSCVTCPMIHRCSFMATKTNVTLCAWLGEAFSTNADSFKVHVIEKIEIPVPKSEEERFEEKVTRQNDKDWTEIDA
jgi:hypothetical protein